MVVADVNQSAGDALAAELGPPARFVRCDVTDEASVRAAIESTRGRWASSMGSSNARGFGAGRVLSREGPHDLALFRRVVEVNLVGTSTCCGSRPPRWPTIRPAPTANGV